MSARRQRSAGQEEYERKRKAVSSRGKPDRAPVAAATVVWWVPGDSLTLTAKPLPAESKESSRHGLDF